MPANKLLTFSEIIGIPLSGKEEWFNPVLIADTPLCLDPFLILDLEEDDEFKGGHDEIVQFFNEQFVLLAKTGGSTSHPNYAQAFENLHLPEVRELCLGYTVGSTAGLGSAAGIAKTLVGAMMFSIHVGLNKVNHFEEIGILRAGIGPDRISDACANLLKYRLAAYTNRICRSLNVPTAQVVVDRAIFDKTQARWKSIKAELPIVPQTGRPILLSPKRFLRHLPTLGSDEFREFVWRKYREAHKDDLNRKILTEADKQKIIDEARKNENVRGEFLNAAVTKGGHPYDFDRDPWGILNWEEPAKKFIASNPFNFHPPKTSADFLKFVRDLAIYFKHFIEQ